MCLLVTTVSPATTVELIEMSFGGGATHMYLSQGTMCKIGVHSGSQISNTCPVPDVTFAAFVILLQYLQFIL